MKMYVGSKGGLYIMKDGKKRYLVQNNNKFGMPGRGGGSRSKGGSRGRGQQAGPPRTLPRGEYVAPPPVTIENPYYDHLHARNDSPMRHFLGYKTDERTLPVTERGRLQNHRNYLEGLRTRTERLAALQPRAAWRGSAVRRRWNLRRMDAISDIPVADEPPEHAALRERKQQWDQEVDQVRRHLSLHQVKQFNKAHAQEHLRLLELQKAARREPTQTKLKAWAAAR